MRHFLRNELYLVKTFLYIVHKIGKVLFDWKEKINPEFFLNFPDLCVYVKTEKTFFSDDISVRGYYVYFEFLDKYYSLNIGLDIFNDIYVVRNCRKII